MKESELLRKFVATERRQLYAVLRITENWETGYALNIYEGEGMLRTFPVG